MIKEVEVGSHTNMCNDSTSYFIALKEFVRFGLIMRRLCEKNPDQRMNSLRNRQSIWAFRDDLV